MGINLDPLKLSASVPFPVPCGTPMISPLIKWDHSQSWEVPQYLASKKEYSFDVDLTSKDSDDYYLLEHKIDGRSMLPGASLIFMVWQALAEREGKEWNEMPVMFKDFIIHRATYLKLNGMFSVLMYETRKYWRIEKLHICADQKYIEKQ